MEAYSVMFILPVPTFTLGNYLVAGSGVEVKVESTEMAVGRLTTEQKVFLVKHYEVCQGSVKARATQYKKRFRSRSAPHRNFINALIARFEASGSVADADDRRTGRPRTATVTGNIKAVTAESTPIAG
ncbi:histone-lysine n-methyltransferase setmar-like protein [Lasius niger]|uniref:Histone-lysine n-methyltransferase setmar-like protein n=1 Tax=Lasius niger TaxID=67767 RepID=A0A0J7JV16_LASNI|nr:histone-lysine n-methyltransferase setmar-like protein [Lasius niger]